MRTRLLVVATLLWAAPAVADRLFSDSFDPYHIDPQFPLVGGIYQLPSGPATDQLAWLLSELQTGETTTVAEAQAHFDPVYSAQATADFVNSLRVSFPDAIVKDVVAITPLQTVVVIDTPGGTPPHGYTIIQTPYAPSARINYIYVSNYSGTVQYPEDQDLTLDEAADKFATFSSSPALVVARIRPGEQCEIVETRNADTLRATASIFKIWVLGAVGRAIADGVVMDDEIITLVADELAPGGLVYLEPVGTQFPLGDLVDLMIGISDNTATDLLHERVGRSRIEQVLVDFGHSQPQFMTPLLNVSEQFHLFFSFPPSVASAYVNGTEAYQVQFLVNDIEPLGSIVGDPYPYNNADLFTAGSWQASPMDICRAFAHLRRLPQGSDAMVVVDRALGRQVAQPEVRAHWDRAWYKGGSLSRANGDYDVLTHAWMLENAGEDPWVVVAMSNQQGGGISNADAGGIQSVTGRMLEIAAGTP